MISILGDAGRAPCETGELWSDERRSALKESNFLTLLGRFGLLELIEGDEGEAETVVLN